MALQRKKKNESAESTENTENSNEGNVLPMQKKLTKEDRKKLFQAYDEVDKRADELRAEQEKVDRERSDRVKDIFDACGKGPFEYNGRRVKIASRPNRSKDMMTYFFRGGKEEVERID